MIFNSLFFFRDKKPELNIVRLDEYFYSKADFWFKKLSKDKLLSYYDVISYVVVREKLDDIACISFDQDFKT